MSLNYVNRSHDEEIIDILKSVMDNGTGKAETAYEHILLKLMQLRGTPMTSFEFDQERVDFHYNQWKLVMCPDCRGDGKETCHNPDHGFLTAMSYHDIGRIGCPCCGHDRKHKVKNGGPCYTCDGSGKVKESDARKFCFEMDYDYDDIFSLRENSATSSGSSELTRPTVEWLINLPTHGDKANCPSCTAPGNVDLDSTIKIPQFNNSIWWNPYIPGWECVDCCLK